MTYVDLVALLSSFLVLLAIGGTVADRAFGEAQAHRDQAHRVR